MHIIFLKYLANFNFLLDGWLKAVVAERNVLNKNKKIQMSLNLGVLSV
jgi:hypothetical protein